MHCYTLVMALGSQLPVRLPPEIDVRLERVASRIGTTKSALIRMLAKTFVEQVVDEDDNVTLPPKWQRLLETADGRSSYALNEPSSTLEDTPKRPAQKVSYRKGRKSAKGKSGE